MDPNWLAMAYQDMMRRRMMENQQASQYLQAASPFSSPNSSMGNPPDHEIQNNPHVWGLQDVLDSSQNMMRDLGGSGRNWIRRRETNKRELARPEDYNTNFGANPREYAI